MLDAAAFADLRATALSKSKLIEFPALQNQIPSGAINIKGSFEFLLIQCEWPTNRSIKIGDISVKTVVGKHEYVSCSVLRSNAANRNEEHSVPRFENNATPFDKGAFQNHFGFESYTPILFIQPYPKAPKLLEATGVIVVYRVKKFSQCVGILEMLLHGRPDITPYTRTSDYLMERRPLRSWHFIDLFQKIVVLHSLFLSLQLNRK